MLIQKVREQIASDRIAEFMAGMNQLGFTEQEIVDLLEKRRGRRANMEQKNELVVCQGLTQDLWQHPRAG